MYQRRGSLKTRGGGAHLDDPVSCAGREPLVARFDRARPNPAQVARDDAREFPRRVIVGLDLASFPSPDEGLREESRLGMRDGDRGVALVDGRQGLRAGGRPLSVHCCTHANRGQLRTSAVRQSAPSDLQGKGRIPESATSSSSAAPTRNAGAPSMSFLCGSLAAAGPAGRAGPTPPFCCATSAAGRTRAFRYSDSILVARRTFVL